MLPTIADREGRLEDRALRIKAELFPYEQIDVDALLDDLARRMLEHPDAILVLEGRTDSTGNDSYNVRLGERRLETVIRYLVVDQGVPIHRLHKMSFGEARPVAPNNSREGRAQNRSVVIQLLEPQL